MKACYCKPQTCFKELRDSWFVKYFSQSMVDSSCIDDTTYSFSMLKSSFLQVEQFKQENANSRRNRFNL